MSMNEDDTRVSFSASAADAQAFAALEGFDRERGDDTVAESASRADACERYAQLRPRIVTIGRWVERLPCYGRQIAGVIRFLVRVADTTCA